MMQHELDPNEIGGGGPPEENQRVDRRGETEEAPDQGHETTPEEAERQEFLNRFAQVEQQVRIRAQETINELSSKLERGEQLSNEDWEQFEKAQEVISRVTGGAGRGQGLNLPPEMSHAINNMTATGLLENKDRLIREGLPAGVFEELLQRKKQEEQQAAYYQFAQGYMREHWSVDQKKEWLHHQMHILISSRVAPSSAETKIAYQLLESALVSIRNIPELQDEYQHFIRLYDHFTRMITTTDFAPIMDSASEKFKSKEINDMFKIPFMAEAFRIWDQNGSYEEFLKNKVVRGIDTNGRGERRPLKSVVVLSGPALELRRLAMGGEMAKWKLAEAELKKQGVFRNTTDRDSYREQLIRAEAEVERKLTEKGLRLEFLDSRIHQGPIKPDEIPADINGTDRVRMEVDWNGWAKDQYGIQKAGMIDKINRFIETEGLDRPIQTGGKEIIEESFFTETGETVEAAQLLGKVEGAERDGFHKRNRGEALFEDAQLSLELGEAAWRLFERAALMDGSNPNEVTPEGGGENPLRRLLSLQKYAQELMKDGKLKHVQPQIVEHLVNPVRDFISDPGDGFWRQQPKIVYDWYLRMVRDREKIDRYGRFLDLSDCPIEYIDFSYYQEIPDRSPFAPHYSNFSELVEELRKQEALKPGALLETPNLENYINFVKLYRNLRSEDTKAHREAREAEAALARDNLARYPNVSREEASYELFRGLISYWRDNKNMPKESIINAILMISDPFQETFITPKYRDKLIKEIYGKFWGSWPLWDIRQQWAKIDWGAGLKDAFVAFFKAIFSSK